MSREKDRGDRESEFDAEMYQTRARLEGLGNYLSSFGSDHQDFDAKMWLRYEQYYNQILMTYEEGHITRQEFVGQVDNLFNLMKADAQKMGFTEEELSDEKLEQYQRSSILEQIHKRAGMKPDRKEEDGD